jgi:hypothetical protein
MNLTALRYSLINNAEGIKEKSTVGDVRQIMIKAISTHHYGIFYMQYTYNNTHIFGDDIYMLLKQGEHNAVYKNS